MSQEAFAILAFFMESTSSWGRDGLILRWLFWDHLICIAYCFSIFLFFWCSPSVGITFNSPIFFFSFQLILIFCFFICSLSSSSCCFFASCKYYQQLVLLQLDLCIRSGHAAEHLPTEDVILSGPEINVIAFNFCHSFHKQKKKPTFECRADIAPVLSCYISLGNFCCKDEYDHWRLLGVGIWFIMEEILVSFCWSQKADLTCTVFLGLKPSFC